MGIAGNMQYGNIDWLIAVRFFHLELYKSMWIGSQQHLLTFWTTS